MSMTGSVLVGLWGNYSSILSAALHRELQVNQLRAEAVDSRFTSAAVDTLQTKVSEL
jgi:hypothetical protein